MVALRKINGQPIDGAANPLPAPAVQAQQAWQQPAEAPQAPADVPAVQERAIEQVGVRDGWVENRYAPEPAPAPAAPQEAAPAEPEPLPEIDYIFPAHVGTITPTIVDGTECWAVELHLRLDSAALAYMAQRLTGTKVGVKFKALGGGDGLAVL